MQLPFRKPCDRKVSSRHCWPLASMIVGFSKATQEQITSGDIGFTVRPNEALSHFLSAHACVRAAVSYRI